MAIHYSKCRNAFDVSRLFGMSKEAAEYAYENYISWYKFIQRNNNRMTTLDRSMYYHFYDENYRKFVYCRKECRHCGKEFVNSEWRICEKCKRIAEIRGNMHDSYEADINMLHKWIYNMNKNKESFNFTNINLSRGFYKQKWKVRNLLYADTGIFIQKEAYGSR